MKIFMMTERGFETNRSAEWIPQAGRFPRQMRIALRAPHREFALTLTSHFFSHA